MKYSVCIPAVLGGSPLRDALRTVREAGFDRYEIWSWWDLDGDACLAAQQKEGLSMAAACTRFISLTDPACRKAYLEGLRETAAFCEKLGCRTVISQVGQTVEGATEQYQHNSIVHGLRESLPVLREFDLTLVIEPLNTKTDHPGYYLWRAREAFRIVEEVGDSHVKVLYDLYHQAVTEDLSTDEIVRNIDKIGHFHLAGCPGRHEPLTDSRTDFLPVLEAIRTSGYTGNVGLEYFPTKDPGQGLEAFLHTVTANA